MTMVMNGQLACVMLQLKVVIYRHCNCYVIKVVLGTITHVYWQLIMVMQMFFVGQLKTDVLNQAMDT